MSKAKDAIAEIVAKDANWFATFDPHTDSAVFDGDTVLADLVRSVVNYNTGRVDATESLQRYLESSDERETQTLTAGDVGTIEASELLGEADD